MTIKAINPILITLKPRHGKPPTFCLSEAIPVDKWTKKEGQKRVPLPDKVLQTISLT